MWRWSFKISYSTVFTLLLVMMWDKTPAWWGGWRRHCDLVLGYCRPLRTGGPLLPDHSWPWRRKPQTRGDSRVSHMLLFFMCFQNMLFPLHFYCISTWSSLDNCRSLLNFPFIISLYITVKFTLQATASSVAHLIQRCLKYASPVRPSSWAI